VERPARSSLFGAAALLAVVATAGGCKGKSSREKAQEAVAAVEGMNALPASVDVVLGAEVAALSRSLLVERAVARMLTSDPGLKADLDSLFQACNFDPVRDLGTVLVAMDNAATPAATAADRTLLVASGQLSEGNLAACVGRHLSRAGGQLVQKSADGRVHYHADSPPGRLDVWFAFGAPKTLLVSSSPEFLSEALADGPRLAADGEMAELVHRARVPGAALWAAGRVPADIGKGLAAATGGKVGAPRAMFGHIAAETGLTAQLGVELASPAEANTAASLTKEQLKALTQIAQRWRLGRAVAKIALEAVGQTLFLRLALSDEELRQALAPIDSDAGPDQNPAPPSGDEGALPNGQGDASPGG